MTGNAYAQEDQIWVPAEARAPGRIWRSMYVQPFSGALRCPAILVYWQASSHPQRHPPGWCLAM